MKNKDTGKLLELQVISCVNQDCYMVKEPDLPQNTPPSFNSK